LNTQLDHITRAAAHIVCLEGAISLNLQIQYDKNRG
jgi:hypothetical protein